MLKLVKDRAEPASIQTAESVSSVPEIPEEDIIYSEQDKVGEGTFGECFIGKYRNHIPVILKKVKVGDVAEVKREAKTLMELKHQNIPIVFGVNTPEKMIVIRGKTQAKNNLERWKKLSAKECLIRTTNFASASLNLSSALLISYTQRDGFTQTLK